MHHWIIAPFTKLPKMIFKPFFVNSLNGLHIGGSQKSKILTYILYAHDKKCIQNDLDNIFYAISPDIDYIQVYNMLSETHNHISHQKPFNQIFFIFLENFLLSSKCDLFDFR